MIFRPSEEGIVSVPAGLPERGVAYVLVSPLEGGVASLHFSSNEDDVASVPGCYTKGVCL